MSERTNTGIRLNPRYGPLNGFWKGGKPVASNGYRLVRVGVQHHLSDVRGYAYEHRIVAEAKLGRRLLPGEQIHHINGDKLDNRLENIEIHADRLHHSVRHRKPRDNPLRTPDQPNPVVSCACGCGSTFPKFDSTRRPRRFITGHNSYL